MIGTNDAVFLGPTAGKRTTAVQADVTQTVRLAVLVTKQNKVLAQVFQAIRIEVNGEMEVLKEFLRQAAAVLSPGGRLSVISYHSLEDRLVKRYINNGVFEGEPEKDFYGNVRRPFKRIGKLILPSGDEIIRNNRARSAKLRIAERTEEEAF